MAGVQPLLVQCNTMTMTEKEDFERFDFHKNGKQYLIYLTSTAQTALCAHVCVAIDALSWKEGQEEDSNLFAGSCRPGQ